MKLQPVPFAAIKAGTKTIESRLYDEKRQKIRVGDQILFRNSSNLDETILTRVEELFNFSMFSELFQSIPASSFGGESAEELETQIFRIYSKEDETKFGVLGIRISRINTGRRFR